MWLSALCTNACQICLSTCGYDKEYSFSSLWASHTPPLDTSCITVEEVCGATNSDLECRHLHDIYNWYERDPEYSME